MLFLETLFEDEDLVAINKPSGTPSHSLPHQNSAINTIESLLKQQHSQIQAAHRLDTGTSGVLLLAKNPLAYKELRELFQLKLLQKTYWAWVESTEATQAAIQNRISQLPFKIDFELGHHPKSSKRMVVIDPNKSAVKNKIRGKAFPALTWIEAVEESPWQHTSAFRFTVRIETGVTHQIRAHLAHLGFPLLGDTLYKRKTSTTPTQPPGPQGRLALHARSIGFQWRGRQYFFEAPLVTGQN